MKTIALALILSFIPPAFAYDYRQQNDDEQTYQYNNRQRNDQQREDQWGEPHGLNRRQYETNDNIETERQTERTQGNPMDDAMKKYKHYGSSDSE